MFHRSAQATFSFLTALVILTMGSGCLSEVPLVPFEPGSKYGFTTAVSFLFLIGVSRTDADAATTTPQLLISEPNGPGAVPGAGSVYLYEKSGQNWMSDDKFFAANGANRDRFGSSLATKGADVIVGAPTASSGAGCAYVFAYANTTFNQQGTLQASDAAANDSFGQAVAMDGNLALVSAPLRDETATNSGVVYAFARTGTTWTQTQKLFTAIPDANDTFGLAVLLDGTEALISSQDDSGNPAGGGRVHTWNRVSNVWTEGPLIKPSDPSQYKGFGASLARQGKWLIVGAPSDSQTATRAGAVYVFERVGNAWIERQKLRANDGAADEYFGTSVAIDGNWLVVGAIQADGKATGSGAAYVYELDGTWTFAGKLIASEGKTGEFFGSSCGVAGDQVVVGAPKTTVDGFEFAGAGYVFTIPDTFDASQRIVTEAKRIAFGRKSRMKTARDQSPLRQAFPNYDQ